MRTARLLSGVDLGLDLDSELGMCALNCEAGAWFSLFEGVAALFEGVGVIRAWFDTGLAGVAAVDLARR